jgi:hypothetical protein
MQGILVYVDGRSTTTAPPKAHFTITAVFINIDSLDGEMHFDGLLVEVLYKCAPIGYDVPISTQLLT